MEHKLGVSLGWLGRKLRGHILAGILVVVPIGVTVLILIWIFSGIDNVLQPVIKTVWGDTIPGVGFGITIVLIYLIGVIASNVLGKKLVGYGESLLAKVPGFRQIYTGIRQILLSFSAPRQAGFMQVVLVEFPRKGMRAIGFVTNESTDKAGETLLHIFVPTSPNPTSGFLQIVREDEIVRTKISVDDALKMLVSAGRVLPKEAREGLLV